MKKVSSKKLNLWQRFKRDYVAWLFFGFLLLVPFSSAYNFNDVVRGYVFNESDTTFLKDWSPKSLGNATSANLTGSWTANISSLADKAWQNATLNNNHVITTALGDVPVGANKWWVHFVVRDLSTTQTANAKYWGWGDQSGTRTMAQLWTYASGIYFATSNNDFTVPEITRQLNEYAIDIVYNGGTYIEFYLNGTFVRNSTLGGNFNIAATNFFIGKTPNDVTGALDFVVSELVIFNNTPNAGDLSRIQGNWTNGCGFANGTGGWNCTTGGNPPSSNPSLTFNAPSNGTVQYYTNNNLIVNTTSNNYGGTKNTTHYLYNSTGHEISRNSNLSSNYTSTFSNLAVGTYYANATISNGTLTNKTSTSTVYIFNITPGTLSPSNGSTTSTRYLSINWTNANVNPSLAPVSQTNANLTLRNSDGSLNRTISSVNTNNNYTWDIYAENLSTGVYYLRINYTVTGGVITGTESLINITTNTAINITAIRISGASAINNFSGWISGSGVNNTYSTTTGSAIVNAVRGSQIAYIEANGYAIVNTTNYVNLTVNAPSGSYQFSLYETNTLNITFYDQETNTIISGPLITLDLIGGVASYVRNTSNGTMYIALLQPDTYTLRYYAPGYATRFYYLTVTNRSYQTLDLYLINLTGSSNITIYVIDDVTNPVENATVKAMKYDLTTNTYILQEIAQTDVDGKVIMSLTKNDEYYKFMVEYNSELLKVTNPAYITTDSLTIQVLFSQDIGEEYYNYKSISYSLTFNPSTNNFRLDFTDSNNVATQMCLYVYKSLNYTQPLQNSTCTTSSSGTILIPITPLNGTTYFAKAIYTEDSQEKYLAGLTYSFPESTSNLGYKLFLQIIITLASASFAIASASVAAIVVPLSLIIGNYIGLNAFSMASLIILQIVGIIISIVISTKR
jgi:hypothetical protein